MLIPGGFLSGTLFSWVVCAPVLPLLFLLFRKPAMDRTLIGMMLLAEVAREAGLFDWLAGGRVGQQTLDNRLTLGVSYLQRRDAGELAEPLAVETHLRRAVQHRALRQRHHVVALDDRREWYRYHHLFAELLRHELARTRPGLVAELHRRASAWAGQQSLQDNKKCPYP